MVELGLGVGRTGIVKGSAERGRGRGWDRLELSSYFITPLLLPLGGARGQSYSGTAGAAVGGGQNRSTSPTPSIHPTLHLSTTSPIIAIIACWASQPLLPYHGRHASRRAINAPLTIFINGGYIKWSPLFFSAPSLHNSFTPFEIH